jgi:hypothetical protein
MGLFCLTLHNYLLILSGRDLSRCVLSTGRGNYADGSDQFVGAAPCGRPHTGTGQAQGPAPTIFILYLAAYLMLSVLRAYPKNPERLHQHWGHPHFSDRYLVLIAGITQPVGQKPLHLSPLPSRGRGQGEGERRSRIYGDLY